MNECVTSSSKHMTTECYAYISVGVKVPWYHQVASLQAKLLNKPIWWDHKTLWAQTAMLTSGWESKYDDITSKPMWCDHKTLWAQNVMLTSGWESKCDDIMTAGRPATFTPGTDSRRAMLVTPLRAKMPRCNWFEIHSLQVSMVDDIYYTLSNTDHKVNEK